MEYGFQIFKQRIKNGGICRKTKYSQGIMIWLGVCYGGVARPVTIEKGTINRQIYIKKMLPIAPENGQKLTGKQLTY